MLQKRIIEICANSARSCVKAEAGGATRVELCAAIPEGGTTPRYGEIRAAQTQTSVTFHRAFDIYCNPNVPMGNPYINEFEREETDRNKVAAYL